MVNRFRILAIILIITASLTRASAASEKTFSFDVDFGAAKTTFLPLNENGKEIYGQSTPTNPLGASIIWAAAPGLNIGISCSTARWFSDDNHLIDGNIYDKATLSFSSISPFIDLSPFVSGDPAKRGIRSGFFVEVGPSQNTLIEQYKLNGEEQVFTASGTSIDVRVGFRAVRDRPLGFVGRAKFSIPIAHDNRKSDTGISLNGAATMSIHAGVCLNF